MNGGYQRLTGISSRENVKFRVESAGMQNSPIGGRGVKGVYLGGRFYSMFADKTLLYFKMTNCITVSLCIKITALIAQCYPQKDCKVLLSLH